MCTENSSYAKIYSSKLLVAIVNMENEASHTDVSRSIIVK